jgi:hypothetical protein
VVLEELVLVGEAVAAARDDSSSFVRDAYAYPRLALRRKRGLGRVRRQAPSADEAALAVSL